DTWLAASMTADGVREAVGPTLGPAFWMLTLFCGFLVLSTSMATGSDGFLRRWVDVFWTASPQLRAVDPRHIGKVYFGALRFQAACALTMLRFVDGGNLLVYSTMPYNYELGVSSFHTLAVNTILLPAELRPGWLRRAGLFLTGVFFTAIAVLTTIDKVNGWRAEAAAANVEAAVTAPAEIENRTQDASTTDVAGAIEAALN